MRPASLCWYWFGETSAQGHYWARCLHDSPWTTRKFLADTSSCGRHVEWIGPMRLGELRERAKAAGWDLVP